MQPVHGLAIEERGSEWKNLNSQETLFTSAGFQGHE